jgi:hypothetical protein
MRRFFEAVFAVVLLAGCGGGSSSSTGSGSTGVDAGSPAVDAGTPDADAGTPSPDAGLPGIDGGLGGGPGTSPDAGTPPDECAGLTPASVGTPVRLDLTNVDLTNSGQCTASDVDGTGHVAIFTQNQFTGTNYTFFEAATGASIVQEYESMRVIGQASGFMGKSCEGGGCFTQYFVLGPEGETLFTSPGQGTGTGFPINNPIGGMIQIRFVSQESQTVIWLDSIDASGTVRWSAALPDLFGVGVGPPTVAADRAGNTLAIWAGTQRFGANSWAAQWFDRSGTAGPVFRAPDGVAVPILFERVGSGLFLDNDLTRWSQIDALATSFAKGPAWLDGRDVNLHMVHGGTGYAVLPKPSTSAACQQQVEVVAPSGKNCGTATFSIDGAACTTSDILVGFDGTVVQKVPQERQAACTAGGHQCTCSWQAWAGFFR